MTVETTNAIDGPFYPNGATTDFPFTFTAPTADEVSVAQIDADGVETTVSTALYSVTLNAESGGTVSFSSAPASGVTLYVLLNPDFDQEIDFTDRPRFAAEAHNEGFDRSVARDQAMNREIARALRVPRGAAGLLVDTPNIAAGQVLALVGGKLRGVDNTAAGSEESATRAEDARDAAVVAQGAAEDFRDEAEGFKDGAETAQAGAQSARDEALQYGSANVYATWTALAAATGMSAGDIAFVVAADTGTHTDPVVGGTVDNAGVFEYSASPAGWGRIGDLESQLAAEQVVLAGVERSRAEAFADQARNALSGALTTSASPASLLAAQHESGLFIDVSGDADTSVIVKDADDAANDSIGDLYSVYPASTFPQPKLVVDRAGALQWSAHNNAKYSATFSNAIWTKTNCTVASGYLGSDGRTKSAWLLTCTTSGLNNNYLDQNVSQDKTFYRTEGFELRAGTSGWAVVEGTDGASTYRAWFNLTDGTVGTVDSGITAQISDFDIDGNRYADGWRLCTITRLGLNDGRRLRVRPVDGDGSVSVTLNRTIYVDKARVHRGVKRLDYLATTDVARFGIPYDYWTGEIGVRFDIATTYRGRYSDDFTNAAWVKSNVTAALNATGPHGEPCSTITATADGGHVQQAVTSSGTQQMGFAWIRRKTGAGTLEMSMDGGSTYTDVTDQVGRKGGTFSVVYLRGFAANPTLRFRIGTNGDEFEIALANVSNRTHLPPPVPSVAADYTMSSNDGRAPLAGLPTASEMTVYIDGIYSPEKKTGETGLTQLGFFGSGSQICAAEARMSVTGGELKTAINDGTGLRNYSIRSFTNAGRVQAAAKYEANRHAICVNGEVPFPDTRPGSMTLTGVGVSTTESFWLKRLVMVPEAISENDDSLRTFNLDRTGENVKKFILATHHLYEYGSRTDADRARIPALAKLWDEDDRCALMAMVGERNVNSLQTSPTINEHPQRGVLNRLIYDHSTRSFSSDTGGLQVFLENSLHAWSTGLGGVQGYTPHLIENGLYKGRLLHVFIQQDSPIGDKSDGDFRNLYVQTSDDLGDTWSTPVKVIDQSTIGGATGFVAPGENSTVVEIPPHMPNAGRIYISFNMKNSFMGVAWTDDFADGGDGSGENWSHTAFADGFAVRNTAVSGWALTEPAVFMTPNGDIGIAMRNNNSGAPMPYAISTDYGVSFSAPQAFPGINVSTGSNQGVVQTNIEGGRGRIGRLIIGRATGDGGIDHVLQYTTDNDFTLSNPIRMLGKGRFGRYTALEWWPEKGVLFVLVEIQPVTPANTDTGMMLVAVDWAEALASIA